MYKHFLGIDPGGSSGGIAIYTPGERIEAYKMPEIRAEIATLLSRYSDNTFCILEKVHSMPGQGVSSTFAFGKNVGHLEMAITCCQIPFTQITPQEWQKNLKCLTKGDKNITKQKAIELFPYAKVTHAVADAMLIAFYCYQYCLSKGLAQGASSSSESVKP